MTHVYMARQPIYTSDLQLYAYEILYRAGRVNAASVGTDPDAGGRATASVILSAFEIGIPLVTGSRRAFVNLSEELLLSDRLDLPPEWVVLELLESVKPSEEIIAAVRRLKARGYVIALDDFEFDEAWRPLLALADIVKVDVMALGIDGVREVQRHLRPFKVTLLAEKVETREEFEDYKAMGFSLFQGYFFARPKILSRRTIPANRLVALRLLAASRDPEADFGRFEALLKLDAGLGYRLLRYVNSPFFAVAQPVESIRQAMAMLGLNGLRSWVALVALASMDDKPAELLNMALIRAKLCEAFAELTAAEDPSSFFTVGLFSLLEALTDAPLEALMQELTLSEATVGALLHGEGQRGAALAFAQALERGDGDAAEALLPGPRLEDIAQIFLRAVAWSDETLAQLRGS